MDEEKCAQCGTAAVPGAKFCESCGAPLAAASQPVEGPAITKPAPMYAAQAVEMQYQGVGIRFVAFIIDAIILGIISSILTAPFTASAVSYDAATGAFTLGATYYALIGVTFVIELLYFTLLLGLYGKSVGM
ncbi:MAG: RDD family protein, partial [Halobacteriota archaeon]